MSGLTTGLALHEVRDHPVGVAETFLEPFEIEGVALLLRQAPVNVGVAEPFGKVGKDDGRGVGDVEAFCEAVHRDEGGTVRALDSLIREPRQLCAEEEGGLPVQGQVVDGGPLLVGQRGHHIIALRVQVIDTLPHVVPGVRVVVQSEPLVGPHADVLVDLESVAVLHDVGVLHTVTLATAHHRADVLRLVEILQHHRHVTGAVGKDFQQARLALLGYKLFQICGQLVS